MAGSQMPEPARRDVSLYPVGVEAHSAVCKGEVMEQEAAITEAFVT
jgi:hypothetical protein